MRLAKSKLPVRFGLTLAIATLGSACFYYGNDSALAQRLSSPSSQAQASDQASDQAQDSADSSQSQAAPVYRQPKRLGRPGGEGGPQGGSKAFSLGIQQQHMGAQAEDNAPLHAGTINEAFPTVNSPLQAGAAQTEGGGNTFALGSSQNGSNMPVLPIVAKTLSNYDIELIVDQSGSMRTPDCPNFMSRWDWCGMQAHELAAQLAPYTPKGLTITNFSNDYQVHQNASPQNIADLFHNGDLGMGTRLAEPLADRLNNYFRNKRPGSKPVLIAIITDGVPTPRQEPAMVADALIDASHKMKEPHELTIVFFQIGGFDLHGRAFLQDLDNNLVGYGAKYDIVRSVDFDRLQQVGLARALVDSIQDFAKQQQQTPQSAHH